MSTNAEMLRAMRDELRQKQAAAREAKAAAKVAKEAYQAEKLECDGARIERALIKAETREQRAIVRVAEYAARSQKIRDVAEKERRLADQKAAMNAARNGARVAVHGSHAGRTFAADQIARTHGVSEEKPRWQPRPARYIGE